MASTGEFVKSKEEKRNLYSLILGQLVKDGYTAAARLLAQHTYILPPTQIRPDDEDRLAKLVQLGLQKERELGKKAAPETTSLLTGEAESENFGEELTEGVRLNNRCLDFELEAQVGTPKRTFPNYQTRFITTHKNAVRCAKFSPDGMFVATGSEDTSIKLLDVVKMKNYNQVKSEHGEDYAPAKPVIRTFYDHSMAINDLDFHPFNAILISAGKDNTIKFYDFSHPNNKRSYQFIQDSHNVRSIHFHPTGDYILAGTELNVVKVYDVATMQCFVGQRTTDLHMSPINQVKWSPEGNIYASAGKDGLIKLWDSVTSNLINTIPKAHAGFEVTSIQFSKNQKYLLSGGKDGTIRLWELSTGRQIQHIVTGPQWKHRIQVSFNYNEDFIVTSDETAYSGVIWDTRSGEVVQRLGGHTNVVPWVAPSPVENSVITCSADHRARFWTEEPGNSTSVTL